MVEMPTEVCMLTAGIAASWTDAQPAGEAPVNTTIRVCEGVTQKVAFPVVKASLIHSRTRSTVNTNRVKIRVVRFIPGVSGDIANGWDGTSPDVDTKPPPPVSCPDGDTAKFTACEESFVMDPSARIY